jgi:hypothetical protein
MKICETETNPTEFMGNEKIKRKEKSVLGETKKRNFILTKRNVSETEN